MLLPVVHMLASRSCCDEVEKPLRLGMDRPARRGDECAERVSSRLEGEVVFRDLNAVSVIQGRRDGCWLKSL